MKQAVYDRLQKFVAKVQSSGNAYTKKNYSNLVPDVYSVMYGQKFARVVRNGGDNSSRSVHCFVDLNNGDIYKAATWAAPAKHVRGNIMSADLGMSCMTPYGVVYLR